MSHYAKVVNGKVTKVIRAEAEFFNVFKDDSPGEWIQTSYNTRGNVHINGGTALRANYAGIGHIYNAQHDVFHEPRPYPSWTLDTNTWLWQAPVDRPYDQIDRIWDESTQSWIEA